MSDAKTDALYSSTDDIKAPLLHSGKVREVYDLGDRLLLVVTDRISAHDLKLKPPIPKKGAVLNRLSEYWFWQTSELQANHFIHADVEKLVAEGIIDESLSERYADRITVGRKAERIDIECVVRGHITGGGWRQYQASGKVNGIELPAGMEMNQRLDEVLFTPATKAAEGHDEDITFAETVDRVGQETAEAIRDAAVKLYTHARKVCEDRGVILADCKLEFGYVDGELVLIDECFTPDSSRFWAEENFKLGEAIDSMDKEPVRQWLLAQEKEQGEMPTLLPDHVVRETSERYLELFRRITGDDLEG